MVKSTASGLPGPTHCDSRQVARLLVPHVLVCDVEDDNHRGPKSGVRDITPVPAGDSVQPVTVTVSVLLVGISRGGSAFPLGPLDLL